MTVEELIGTIKRGLGDPEDIFQLYEEAKKLSDDDLKKLRYSGYGESLDMLYSGVLKMKKEGTWESFLAQYRTRKKKSAEEIKRELLERPIER